MTGWDELVAAALLGTERRTPKLDDLPASVRNTLTGDPSEAPPRRLTEKETFEAPPRRLTGQEGPLAGQGVLDVAAVMTAYRRAGRAAVQGLTAVDPVGRDGRPVPGQAANRRLARILDSSQTSVLAEWLRAARERGYRIAPEYLPMLAELGRTRSQLQADVAALAGPRGAWLAGMNPDWQFLTEHAETDESAWLHGSPSQRRHWLTDTRRREPDAAREALAGTWATEPAASRADLLGLLAVNLSAADEEFCESALDDRAASVRQVAVGLLSRIPGSRYHQRMADRVRACLTVTRRSRRRGQLSVTLPAECDAGMLRDGFEQWPRQPVEKRAWWLRQMIASAPLDTLRDLAGSAAEFFRLRIDGCDTDLIHEAVADAAIRERSVAWARALLAISPAAGYRVSELIAVLPPREWAAVVSDLRGPVNFADVVADLPVPWSAELARSMLDVLDDPDANLPWARPASSRLAVIAAWAVPPEALDHPIVHRDAGEEDTWRRRLIETLAFRREMYEDLS